MDAVACTLYAASKTCRIERPIGAVEGADACIPSSPSRLNGSNELACSQVHPVSQGEVRSTIGRAFHSCMVDLSNRGSIDVEGADSLACPNAVDLGAQNAHLPALVEKAPGPAA